MGLALVVALFMCVLAGTATAAPFDRTFAYTQPDGTAIELWGRGDEFHAVFETLDGYTVVFDPAARAYFYAELSADRRELRSSGVAVGRGAPRGEKHLRIDPAEARAQALERHRVWDESVQVSKRWTGVKAQARARMEAARSGVAYTPPEQPTTGQKVGLCLLVDFSDEEATIPQATIDAMLNGDTFTEFGNVYSVKRYFEEVSDGHLTFTNVVTAYVRAPHPKSYYNDVKKEADGQGQLLLGDILAVLKARPDYESVILPTLGALDVDGDQNVLAVSLLFAGANSGVWAYGLWEHAWALPEPVELGNGKRIYYYQLSPMGTVPVIGVFCHETAHMLCGFPDLYDYGYESVGVGYWCLMGHGSLLNPPVEVCAYLKYKAGWASSVITLTRDAALTATVRAGENAFYLYPKNGDPAATEYFILENRQKSGLDAGIPGSGVCIWHVDEA
ncbi:MAG: M6 family metalloprotease domain-containing protein, partial [Opitutaceae bacterium]|nr:M6 family metalloprotease domain-containing protein [Opitutaceae bacterium]